MMVSEPQMQSILVVEDSDDDFEATFRALRRDGNLANPIHRCDNGESALEFLRGEGEYSSLSPSLSLY